MEKTTELLVVHAREAAKKTPFDWRVRRLALCQEWSDAVINRVLDHLQGTPDEVLSALKKAIDGLNLSALRGSGGDYALLQGSAAALGFSSFSAFEQFRQAHPDLSTLHQAKPCTAEATGPIVGVSLTEVVFMSSAGPLCFDRARIKAEVTVGDIVLAGRSGEIVIEPATIRKNLIKQLEPIQQDYMLKDTDAIAVNLRPYLETPHLVDGWITPQALVLKDGNLLSTNYLKTAGGGLILREALESNHAESPHGLRRRFDTGERLDVSHLQTQAKTPLADVKDSDLSEDEGLEHETTVEYGVNEVMSGGAPHNPFDSNFETQEQAEQAGREYLIENPEVSEIVVFRLTIIDNTITGDKTLLTIDRSDISNDLIAEVPRI